MKNDLEHDVAEWLRFVEMAAPEAKLQLRCPC